METMLALNNSFSGDSFQFAHDHQEGRISTLKQPGCVEFTMVGNILELGVRPSAVLYCKLLHELDVACPDPPCSWNY